jgi:hypothetical protein
MVFPQVQGIQEDLCRLSAYHFATFLGSGS